MRSADANFITEKNKEENSPIALIEIIDYDGASNDLTYCAHSSEITFNSKTYTAFPVAYDTVSENSQAEIDIFSVVLGNVSRLIQSYIESYDWRTKKVNVILIFKDYDDDADVYLQDSFYIDAYRADAKTVRITTTSKHDVLDSILPGRRFSRNYCQIKTFKNTDCGYSGSETECNRTFQRCRVLNNQTRFGGCPSTPSRRVIMS